MSWPGADCISAARRAKSVCAQFYSAESVVDQASPLWPLRVALGPAKPTAAALSSHCNWISKLKTNN
jgi:hypothetical protein